MGDGERVTVIGDLVEDVVVWTAGPTRIGTDNPATVRRSRGGSGANVAAAVAAAGGVARFIGRVGADDVGDALARDLGHAGVDVRVQRGGRTGSVVVLVGDDGERTMFPDRAAAAELGAVDHADLAGTRLLHVPLYGFLEPAAAAHLVDAAAVVQRGGGAVTLDLSASSAIDRLGPASVERLLGTLRPVVVFANVDEAAAARLADLRPAAGGLFVVKDGGAPATIVRADGSRATVAPAPIEDVRDTTGAGDVFAGTFLAAWAAGAPDVDACRAGHAAAAGVLGVSGARRA